MKINKSQPGSMEASNRAYFQGPYFTLLIDLTKATDRVEELRAIADAIEAAAVEVPA